MDFTPEALASVLIQEPLMHHALKRNTAMMF